MSGILAHFDRLTTFYHNGCADGVAGAWAIYWALPRPTRLALARLGGVCADGQTRTNTAAQLTIGPVFTGVSHGDPRPPPSLVSGRNVVYVDIVPDPAVLAWVVAEAATVTLLDHHKSAEAAMAAASMQAPGRVKSVYDVARSGAQLGWDWAHPGVPRPVVIDYVADRDLWTYALPESRAINKALQVEGVTRGFGPLTQLMELTAGELDGALALHGKAYLRYEEQQVAWLAAHARPATVAVRLPGEDENREYKVLAVNTPVLRSEVGEAVMSRAAPDVQFAVMWAYVHGQNEIWASARTTRPDVDLSLIAPYIVGAENGGGHQRAAGFMVAGADITAALRPPPEAALVSAD